MHPNSLANLRPPVQKGDPPLNPDGKNQFTYREDCENLFAGHCVDDMAGVLKSLFEKAGSGNDKHIKLILDRAFPAVSKHEHELPGLDLAGLGDELATRAARRRTEGGTRDTDSGDAEDGE